MSEFYNSREESFLYELLDNQDNIVGTLDNVHPGGTLDFSTSAESKGSGSITLSKTRDIDWLVSRVRVSYLWGTKAFPLITALPRIPSEQYGMAVSQNVDLRDKLSILATDTFGKSFSLASGTNIIGAVNSILWSAGQEKIGIEPAPTELVSGLVWEPNTSKLAIINKLLETANYFSLYCDGLGNYRSTPYKAPQSRPVMWTFEDTEGKGSYLPQFSRNYDPYSVPNKVVAIGKSTGAAEASTAEALDYDSPYGFVARGYWLSEVLTNVDGDLQSQANRKLIDSRLVYETFDVTHPYLPFSIYGHENRVVLKNANIRDYDAVCQKQSYSLTEGGLIKSNLRVIV